MGACCSTGNSVKTINARRNQDEHNYEKPTSNNKVYLSKEEEHARRELMAKQYEEKLAKERNRGISKEGQIDAKFREAQNKRIEMLMKENPRDIRNFEVSLKSL